MTQQTNENQTEGRILSIIGMNYTILRAGDRRIADHSKAAAIIAAEIDALTRERDSAYQAQDRLESENLTLLNERNEARAEVERWRAHDALQEKAVAALQAEVGRLTRERDEARGIIEIVRRSASDYEVQAGRLREELAIERGLAQNTISRLTVQYEIANRESALHAKQRDETRAEVERLRPAAEAWEASEAYTALIREMGMSAATPAHYETTKAKYEETNARARAAKEAHD